ncbi:MAG: hypothetical protein ACKVKJ_06040 [Fidelibacterota bacterium]|jgi:hypothetical protein|tara:strand:- start:54 stop:404 length:351 start_codon:yes stop_codon:yes gene_type:complete
MKTIFYFFLIGIGIFGLSAGINPEYITELFWGILLPWLVVLVELFFIYKAKEKKSELTTKVLLTGFVSKMVIFAIYLSVIIYFYYFAPLPFILSFSGSFIVFHTLEAIVLKSLFES